MPALPDWQDQLLSALDGAGPVGQATRSYLHAHKIHLGLRSQSSGAHWLPWKWIELQPRFGLAPADPYPLSLVVHEVRHLQQGWLTALSVYGELDAWQRQFRFLQDSLGWRPEASSHQLLISELLSLPVNWKRDILQQARQLMRAYGGPRYRIDLLPLYPLHMEIAFLLTGRAPSRAT